MKNLFYAALFLFPTLLYSQINFEQGYIINENGEKINALIKNNDWNSNPSVIQYKLNSDDKINQLQTRNLKEFSVGNVKYLRAKVMIDRSSYNLQNLSETKTLKNNEETLLLKSLVEGKVNLYKYNEGDVTRFFYKRENEDIFHQLEYKEYLDSNNRIQKNEAYKNQLKEELSDNEKITTTDIERLVYTESKLKKLFLLYDGLETVDSGDKNKSNFHVYLKPGIGFSNYTINPPIGNNGIGEYKKNSLLYRFGVELEYVLDFNKGKWAIISEPAFQTVNFKVNDYNRRNYEIKYSALQLPLGFKYNMFLGQKSKIYLAGLLSFELILNNDVYNVDNVSTSASGRVAPTFAAGYNYDKFGVEVKWGSVPYFSSQYYGQPEKLNMNGFNISLSYKLF
ncbi:hypothetical protein QWZ06_06570 [Chryseobacterium tructae]|uniref:Outer membrane protein beta-barrel domain-containing protein n=1 Tax=Chryseobacterium tructae TaxID=1037380 RepID=A0ABV7XVL4_9FLAO|nr:hypothetical protein [Chryseobacterium tructae]MDN3691937.1 hypothetical protein [Chryseobacterium tructae]